MAFKTNRPPLSGFPGRKADSRSSSRIRRAGADNGMYGREKRQKCRHRKGKPEPRYDAAYKRSLLVYEVGTIHLLPGSNFLKS